MARRENQVPDSRARRILYWALVPLTVAVICGPRWEPNGANRRVVGVMFWLALAAFWTLMTVRRAVIGRIKLGQYGGTLDYTREAHPIMFNVNIAVRMIPAVAFVAVAVLVCFK